MDSTRPGTPQCACVAGPPPPMTASYVVYSRHATIGNRAEQIANEQSCCSMGLPSYRQALASHSIPMRVCGRPQTSRNGNRPSVSAGQPGCGAPRRNRTGDPILTMEPPGTAVRMLVSPGRARPSGSKLSVLFPWSYALTLALCLNVAGQASRSSGQKVTVPVSVGTRR
jgi:hypothetical protein